MRPRLVAAAALAVLAALPAAASGAPARPQVRDPKGDARGNLAHADIVSGYWSTTGRGESKALVVTMTLAGPVKSEVGNMYEMRAEARACGPVWFSYSPGTIAEATQQLNQPAINDGMGAGRVHIECTAEKNLYKPLKIVVKDNVITWTIAFKDLPPQLQPGTTVWAFEAVADVAEPVIGEAPLSHVGQSIDTAYGDGIWKIR